MPAGAGAVVVVVSRTKCEQGAVCARAQLHVELRGRGRMADDKLVRPCQREAHGASEAKGNQRQQRLQKLDLASETAAHGHRDHPDFVRGEIDKRSDGAAHDERTLRRRPDGQPAVRLGPCDGHVRFQERVVRTGKPIRLAHDHVGLLESCVDVSALQMGHSRDVAGTLLRSPIGGGGRAVNRRIVIIRGFGLVEHQRRSLVHRRRRIDDRP